ncbi:hypothetical protein [Nonomuraea sediminis]|uniref:hypothetical protein n=1 Tax=Nonomuraea sediminis TaxID=2835864 RepID=UPI001BDC4362|nr:hypothetical protein [Nonomuraea sediminis]
MLSDLPRRTGWTIAEWSGDSSPHATQRLLSHVTWDTSGAMSAIHRFAMARLDPPPGPAA